MLAAILTIGNELVSGDTENTNASWLARRLESLGVKVVDQRGGARRDRAGSSSSCGASARASTTCSSPAGSAARPTTSRARRSPPRSACRRSRAGARGRPARALHAAIPSTPRAGRRCPRGSRPLDNPLGGAPGFRIANTWVLPGLPSEMKAMFDRYADELRGDRPIETWRRRYATRESTIASALEQATARWPGVSVGSYPSFDAAGPEVEVVLKSADPEALAAAKSWLEERARPAHLTATVEMVAATQPETYLADLNPAQREAVLTTEGPLLVIAGAGSGKTRVLTYRVAHLLAAVGVKPNEILAITFTNKAAREMKERVEQQLGPDRARDLDHDVPLRLRPHPAPRGRAARLPLELHDLRLGRPGARSSKQCLEELERDPKRFVPRGIHSQISNAKNQLIGPDEYASRVASFYDQTVADVYALYQRKLFASNAVDFDDMLMLTVDVLQRFPEAREKWAKSFRYVLVDEYQDTNHAQYVLLQLLADEHQNLMAVGDPDQSIYALPRRRHPQHPRVRARLPGHEGDPARAELPLDELDPARRERR